MTSKREKRAFVLAGGGSRGALEVGALRALLEAGIQPDLLVGSSVGAVNAVFLSINGFSEASLDKLEDAWREAMRADLLPANMVWLTVRVLFNRLNTHPYQRLREYFIAQGISPDLHFADLQGPPVVLVSADLNTGQPVYYGADPSESVLEGLVASTALPPWMHPVMVDDHFLMDGGAISNLPIEPAILHGATEIFALSLFDPAATKADAYGFGPFWEKLMVTLEARQIYMETRLAEALDIPVFMAELRISPSVALWNFSQTERMFQVGYEQTNSALEKWEPPKRRVAFWAVNALRRIARG